MSKRPIIINEGTQDRVVLFVLESFRINGSPVCRWEARAWADESQTCTYTADFFDMPRRATRAAVTAEYYKRRRMPDTSF